MRSRDGLTEAVFLLIGAALGALLHWGAALASPALGKAVGDPWAVLSALANVAIAFIAWKGFARWETLRRKERQGNFAEEAFLLTLDVWDYLRRATVNLKSTKPEDFHKEGSTLWGNLHSDELIERLYNARLKCKLYLPKAQDAGALKFWMRCKNLDGLLQINLQTPPNGATLRKVYEDYATDAGVALLRDEFEIATAYFRSYALPE